MFVSCCRTCLYWQPNPDYLSVGDCRFGPPPRHLDEDNEDFFPFARWFDFCERQIEATPGLLAIFRRQPCSEQVPNF